MIPTKKRTVYEYKSKMFWKKGKSIYDSYRYTINGKDISADEYFKILLDTYKSQWFLVSRREYETKDGNMCYEVICCTFKQVKE